MFHLQIHLRIQLRIHHGHVARACEVGGTGRWRGTRPLQPRGVAANLHAMHSLDPAQSIDISRRLETWYDRDAGEQLCRALRQRLQPLLDRSFGYHAMQIGPLPGLTLLNGSPINHRIFATGGAHPAASLCCHGDEIPLESDSVDLVIAFHALEFEQHPHGTLREMQRVLRPHGHLAVVGFNPYSLLGISQSLRGFRSDTLWSRHKPVSPHRLMDWLRLLDCKLEAMHYLYPLPIVGNGRLRSAIGRFDAWAMRQQLPGGGIYLAHAIKERAALRPRQQRIAVARAIPGLAVVGSPQAARRRDRAA